MGIAAVLVTILAPWLTDQPVYAWITAALSIGLVGLDALVWRGNARRGVLALFPCIATGAALLGIGWTLALVVS